ncbi:unnamed protein product [Mytilus edulis]|uniref:Uncharacterized protein n=1 Tax=Mytilus edulis TaxID=6550 RepID=A0A8S3QY92_MYTED|nr:unnamed protein product [Mytilus edulis]
MELNEKMYLANNAICSWLSENLDIDDNKLLRSPNISIESIYSKASSDIPNVKEICNQNCIFKMLKAIFPCITKSKLKENGVFILSVKGVKFDLQPGENIRFADINKYVPQQWNVLENTTTTLTLGYLSIEKFNGNSVLMELKIGSDRLIGLFVAGKAINLSDFFIGKSITFTLKSLKGLFKSLRTIGLCYGATLETNESDIFSSSKLCVKEICLTDTKSKNE